jgi:hypothetical protein
MPAIDPVKTRAYRKPKRANVYVPPASLAPKEARRAARAAVPYNERIARGTAKGPPAPSPAELRAFKAAVREARLKQLRAQHRGSGIRAIKRELEGKGVVAKALGAIGHQLGASTGQIVANVGAAPNVARIRPNVRQAAVTPGGGAKLATRTVEDLVNAGAQAIPSVYVPAAGLFEAAKGRPQRIKKFGKDFKQSDPVYNALAAATFKATGDDRAARAHWSKAKKAAAEHPGFTALEIAGGRGVFGRGLGAGVRGTARVTGSKTLRKIGTTERTPRTLAGTNLVQHRRHSRDLTIKALDVYRDRTARKRAAELRDQAAKEANPEKAAELRAKARNVDPTAIRDRDIYKAVDEHTDAVEQVRRINRTKVLQEETKALGTKRPRSAVRRGGPVTSLLTQGIVRPTVKSLTGYLDDLKVAHDRLAKTPDARGKVRANKQLQHDLTEALDRIKSGKVDLDELHDIARRYAGRSVTAQGALIAKGMLDPAQAERARLTPFAARELGAHRDKPYLLEQAAAAKKTAKRAKGQAKRASSRARLKRTAQPYGPLTKQAFTTLGKAETKAQAKRAAAKTARQEASAKAALAREDPLLAGDKTHLSTDQMRAMQAVHGDFSPAFVSQAPNARGARNFYVNAARAPGISGKRRGGTATVEGTLDAHPDLLVEQQARTQGLADAYDGFQSFLRQFAVRKKGKGTVAPFKDKTKAQRKVDDLNAQGDVEWTLVRMNPFAARHEQLQKMLEGTEPHEGVHQQIIDALNVKTEGEGPWAIVPKAAAQRMEKHLRVMNPDNAGLAARGLNQTFRKGVLSLSLPWLLGNVTEATARSAMARAGVGSLVTGHRVLKASERIAREQGRPEAAAEARARTIGTAHYGMADQHVHTSLDQFTDSRTKTLVRALATFKRAPVARHAVWVWNAHTHLTMGLVNKFIEQSFQKAALGRAVKNQELMTPSLFRASQKAVDEAARGVLNPNTAAALGREVDRMYGRYSKFSPTERKALALYTPFAAWMVNAGRFLKEMPVENPGTTAGIAAVEQATTDWRKTHGLDVFSRALPLYLQGSIPGKGGARYRAPTRYTPFSLAADPIGVSTGQILPQIMGTILAGKGLNWKGQPIVRGAEPGPQDELKTIAQSLAEGLIPGFGLGGRIKSKGAHAALLDAAIGKTTPKKKKPSSSRRSGFSSGFGGSGFSSGFSSGFK